MSTQENLRERNDNWKYIFGPLVSVILLVLFGLAGVRIHEMAEHRWINYPFRVGMEAQLKMENLIAETPAPVPAGKHLGYFICASVFSVAAMIGAILLGAITAAIPMALVEFFFNARKTAYLLFQMIRHVLSISCFVLFGAGLTYQTVQSHGITLALIPGLINLVLALLMLSRIGTRRK